MELSCPKCQGSMRSYERNRIVIDQCVGCRGIFLDRGELEALLDAEARYYDGGSMSTVATLPAASGSGLSYARSAPIFDARYDPAPGHASPYGEDRTGHRGRRRHESFLRELFD
jgi:Zn-finger nucleic acid-binding protein